MDGIAHELHTIALRLDGLATRLTQSEPDHEQQTCVEVPIGDDSYRMNGSAFSICEAARKADVPRCDPPSVTIRGIGMHKPHEFRRVDEIIVSDATGNVYVAGHGRTPTSASPRCAEWSDNAWMYTDRPPDAIRALCDAAGVPCPPEEPVCARCGAPFRHGKHTYEIGGDAFCSQECMEKAVYSDTEYPSCPEDEKPAADDAEMLNAQEPKHSIEVAVHCGDGTLRAHSIERIVAKPDARYKDIPRLCVRVNGSAVDIVTATPLRDIQAQAAEAGIDVPQPVVATEYNDWDAIDRIECVWDEHELMTVIRGTVGKRSGGPRKDANGTDLTPSQVVALCELAGWPEPEVRMVCTFCDGDPCEIDPALIGEVVDYSLMHATRVFMRNPLCYNAHYVRESAPDVRTMLAACGRDTQEATQ